LKKIQIDIALQKVEAAMMSLASPVSIDQCMSWYTTLKILQDMGFNHVSVSIDTYNEMKK